MVNNNSILFTSHIMEEVDILCHRVGIISNGVIRCIENPQTLKTRIDPALHLRLEIKPT